jgi:hypothetical protein
MENILNSTGGNLEAGVKYVALGAIGIYGYLKILQNWLYKKSLPNSKIEAISPGPVRLQGNFYSDYKVKGIISENVGSALCVTQVDYFSIFGWRNKVMINSFHDLKFKDETGVIEIKPKGFLFFKFKPQFIYINWFSKIKVPQISDKLIKLGFKPYYSFFGLKISRLYRVKEYLFGNDNNKIELFSNAVFDENKNKLILMELKRSDSFFRPLGFMEKHYSTVPLLLVGCFFVAKGIQISFYNMGNHSFKIIIFWAFVILILVLMSFNKKCQDLVTGDIGKIISSMFNSKK